MANHKLLSALKIMKNRKDVKFLAGFQSRNYAAAAANHVHTKCKIVNGVYVVTLDSPNVKVNSLNTEVMNEVTDIINEVESNPSIEAAVLISGKPGCFIAGADISMIEACKTKDEVVSLSKRAPLKTYSNQLRSIKMSYQLCPTCGKPLINEHNHKILRNKWIKWGVFGAFLTVAGGAIGAFILPFLGFGSAGVAAGSFAASWQGPAVAAGSVFAICQSLGATGLGILLFGAVGSVAGGTGALAIIYNNRELFDWCGCEYSSSKKK